MNKKIILYSTGCPQCDFLVQLLKKNGVEYDLCSDVEEMKELGLSSVPDLQVDGKIYSFKEALSLVRNGGLTNGNEN